MMENFSDINDLFEMFLPTLKHELKRGRGRPKGTTKSPVKQSKPRGRPSSNYAMDEETCIDHALIAYEDEGSIGQTLRHYYYKLLSSGAIVLSDVPGAGKGAYQTLGRYMTRARENSLFPWRGIVDPGRRRYIYQDSVSVGDYMGEMGESNYRLDIWRGQPTRIEVWVEKDGMAAFMHQIVDQYRVPVYVNKGYPSTTILHDAALRYNDGSHWLILYCGDFDPSGLDIQRHIQDGLEKYGVTPDIHRVALTHADTTTLPQVAAQKIKMEDPRAPAFVQEFGLQQKGYELDALPAHILQRKMLAAIKAVMDIEAFKDAIQLETRIKILAEAALENAVESFKELLTWAKDEGKVNEDKHNKYLEAPTQTRVVGNEDKTDENELIDDF